LRSGHAIAAGGINPNSYIPIPGIKFRPENLRRDFVPPPAAPGYYTIEAKDAAAVLSLGKIPKLVYAH
jgi:hypothetical protein